MTRLLEMLIGTLAAIALLLACSSVAARYAAPGLIVDWSDEIIVMLLIWTMFLSGYKVTLERAHIKVDLLTHGRSARWRAALERGSTIALLFYSAGMAAAGAIVVRDAWRLGERTESTARVPTFLYYAALPVGMFLIALAAVLLLAGRGAPVDTDEPETAL
jgi:C4-dicarboxylate transporter DctQ subunit